jgi:hypothetical protein
MRGLAFTVSAGLHSALAFLLFFQWSTPPRSATIAPAPVNPVKLFFPGDDAGACAQKHKNGGGNPGPQPTRPKAHLKRTLDLACIELTILDDTDRQMIPVLRRYHGKIVIVDSGSLTVREAFWVSNGAPVSGVALADGLPVILGKPEWWPEVATLEHDKQGGILVCALFPPDFSGALTNAIEEKARHLGVSLVRRATVSFATSERSGIIVHRVN